MLQLLRRVLRRPSELRPGYEWLHCWDPDVRCEWCGRRSRSRMLALIAWTRPGEAVLRPLDVGPCCAEKFVPWEQEPCTCPECPRLEGCAASQDMSRICIRATGRHYWECQRCLRTWRNRPKDH